MGENEHEPRTASPFSRFDIRRSCCRGVEISGYARFGRRTSHEAQRCECVDGAGRCASRRRCTGGRTRSQQLRRLHTCSPAASETRFGPKMSPRSIATDKINLRLILVSGKTKEFLFSPSESAGDIAQHVFDNWPEGWAEEAVSKAEILRLIYQGRFLHSNVTLGALGLPLGKTTVMHLVPRENLPEPNSQDQRQKSKGGRSSCCSASCCIL